MIMDFTEWLREQIEDRGWSQNELARRAGVTSGYVSMVMTQARKPGADFCTGVARALKVPEITVFVEAGLMSRTTNPEELTLRELYAILSDLPPSEQRAILAEARARYEAAPARRSAPDPATT
jgi:transcriptional regulator with XRE-family HTH domain